MTPRDPFRFERNLTRFFLAFAAFAVLFLGAAFLIAHLAAVRTH